MLSGDDRVLRVAAYCRVSTDKEDQRNSLAAQQAFFQTYIQSHADWELVGVFADEGMSGTSVRQRPQFVEMIHKAMNGETVGFFQTKESLLRDYIIKENYAACRALFYFNYVIDHEGNWHQMWPEDYGGSVNISDRLKWAQDFVWRFLAPLRYGSKKYRLTAVDIHD